MPCFIDGGRFAYEQSSVAHGEQWYRLKCTFHAKCFKSRNAGDVQMSFLGPLEAVANLAVWYFRGHSLETSGYIEVSPQTRCGIGSF